MEGPRPNGESAERQSTGASGALHSGPTAHSSRTHYSQTYYIDSRPVGSEKEDASEWPELASKAGTKKGAGTARVIGGRVEAGAKQATATTRTQSSNSRMGALITTSSASSRNSASSYFNSSAHRYTKKTGFLSNLRRFLYRNLLNLTRFLVNLTRFLYRNLVFC